MSTAFGREIEGIKYWEGHRQADERGYFSKPWVSSDTPYKFVPKEAFWTSSNEGVIRGMHLQGVPDQGAKAVWVSLGKVLDVVLDLRPESSTFRHWNSIELAAEEGTLLVPRGCAHGFAVLNGPAIVNYLQDVTFSASSDIGVRWDSFGFDWPVEDPVISLRDSKLPPLVHFVGRGEAT